MCFTQWARLIVHCIVAVRTDYFAFGFSIASYRFIALIFTEHFLTFGQTNGLADWIITCPSALQIRPDKRNAKEEYQSHLSKFAFLTSGQKNVGLE